MRNKLLLPQVTEMLGVFVSTAKPILSSPLCLQLSSHEVSAKDLVFIIPISNFGIVSDRYVLKYVFYTNEAFTQKLFI